MVEEKEMKEEEEGGGDAGRRRWGVEGGKWLVGEDDGTGRAEGAGGTTLRCPP